MRSQLHGVKLEDHGVRMFVLLWSRETIRSLFYLFFFGCPGGVVKGIAGTELLSNEEKKERKKTTEERQRTEQEKREHSSRKILCTFSTTTGFISAETITASLFLPFVKGSPSFWSSLSLIFTYPENSDPPRNQISNTTELLAKTYSKTLTKY